MFNFCTAVNFSFKSTMQRYEEYFKLPNNFLQFLDIYIKI